jgi:Family of unknown function (DUF6288)/HEAT repeats
MIKKSALFAMMILIAGFAFCQEEGFTLINAPRTSRFNLGPTGVWGYGSSGKTKGGLVLNFFVVDHAEVGSPADGLVKENDLITGVNGKPFVDGEDPRIAMAFAIEDGEAKDGKLRLDLTRGGTPVQVTLKLQKIPAYSPTWPFDCARTDTVLKNACEYLRQEQMPEGDVSADDGNIGPTQAGLLWLATGEPRYLQNAVCAAYWYKEQCEAGKSGWCWTEGYGGLLMAEYYNMTGDTNILAGIENIARIIAKGQMPSGGWSHGGYSGFGAGYGEVNCAGMVDYMALLEARECGVKVDHEAIKRAERYFDKFAPALSNAYGDHAFKPDSLGYGGLNGKVGGMAVAHMLNNKPEYSSLYALKSARSAYGLEGGHTGHFFNMMWTPIAASMAPAKEYRSLMDQLGWYFTLARHWRGGLFCQPNGGRGSKYSDEGGVNMTTGGYGLVLALPRHHLRILGAPKSVFVQTLPAELEAAKKLHQSKQWDAAITAVDAFLKKGGHDKETVRLANELRDKARYVKAGVEEAYSKIEELASGSERKSRLGSIPYKATGIMRHMRMLLGEDDARMKKIETLLPEKFRDIWKHDEEYHKAFRTLHSLNTMQWFIFASLLRQTVPDLAMPADYPAWAPIAEIPAEGGNWKSTIVSPDQKEPEGWAKLDFDDKAWSGPEPKDDGNGKKKKKAKVPAGSAFLVRVPFELDNPNVKQLRIRIPQGAGSIAEGGKVYINGVCVLETYTAVTFRDKITLLDNARSLLRKGRNVFAYSSIGEMPHAVLDADAIQSKSINWTVDPSRDAEIRKLVAQRRVQEPYYQADKDKRTVKELMAVFTAEPFFIPEAYYALDRFQQQLPNVQDRTPYVTELLKSANWGARWCGVMMACNAMAPLDNKELSKMAVAEKDKAKAGEDARVAAGKVWAKQFAPQVVALLKDPHPMVRKDAAEALGLMDGVTKDAVPILLSLFEDVGGQNWYIRKAAYDALKKMQVDEVTQQALMRAGLKDPSSTVRAKVLDATLSSKDPQVQKASVQTYKTEMIEQIFEAPHGMWTSMTRKQMAELALASLSKDELRPLLPRFFASLSQPYGAQLEGCMAIIISFGDEVRPKLEALATSEDLTLRYNVMDALLQMTPDGKLAPERVAFFKRQLEPLLKMTDEKKADIVGKWLKQLESGSWKNTGGGSVSEAVAAGGGGGGNEE